MQRSSHKESRKNSFLLKNTRCFQARCETNENTWKGSTTECAEFLEPQRFAAHKLKLEVFLVVHCGPYHFYHFYDEKPVHKTHTKTTRKRFKANKHQQYSF